MPTVDLSIVTCVQDSMQELGRTLRSLDCLRWRPREVIVVSPILTLTEILQSMELNFLEICAIRDSGAGIYHAMNEGREQAKSDLIMYLNAGDEVRAEPFRDIVEPGFLPYKVVGAGRRKFRQVGYHKLLFGRGYCHQAVIFPSSHRNYAVDYEVSADQDLIFEMVRQRKLNIKLSGGYVIFYKGGISTQRHKLRDIELLKIFYRQRMKRHLLLGTIIFPLKWMVKGVLSAQRSSN